MLDIRFYLDEHIASAVAKGLKSRGIDTLTCIEAGMRTASDMAHIEFAYINKYVIVTCDNDFLRLHSEGKPHAGIAFATHPLAIGEFIRKLQVIHQSLQMKDMENHTEFL